MIVKKNNKEVTTLVARHLSYSVVNKFAKMLFRALALGRRQVARLSNFISLETVKIDRERLLNLFCLLYQREPRMLLKIYPN